MLAHPNLTQWIQTTLVSGSHSGIDSEAVKDACVKTAEIMYSGLTEIFIPHRLDDNTLQKVTDLIKLCSPFPSDVSTVDYQFSDSDFKELFSFYLTDWQLLNGILNPPCSVFDIMDMLYNGEYEEYETRDSHDWYGMTLFRGHYLKYSN